MNKRYELHQVTRDLSKTAMCTLKADMVIKNVKLVNVNTAEIQENIDIAIKKGRIALVGDASHTIGKSTTIIDGKGYYATPGFIDTHIHVGNALNKCGGGMVVVENGKIIAINPLPIVGLMSEDKVELVAKRVHEINHAEIINFISA